MAIELVRHRFTVEEYYQMIGAGVFTEDDRVELIEGEIIEMAAIGFHHAACVKRLNRLLSANIGEDVILGVQDPIHLSGTSEPEPDIVLVRARDDFYIEGHPEPEDILLLIEVSETSLGYDFDVKIPLYGKSGILEAWIVDLQRNELLVFTQPADIGYKQQLRLRKGDTISSQALSFTMPVADILF